MAALCVLSVAAQDETLSKTISMPVEFEPSLLSTSRLSSYPTLLDPDYSVTVLSMSDFTTPSRPTTNLLTLSSPTSPDVIAKSPYRGYAALGYMPVFNLGASAGYRIIDTNKTQLGAWLQYNGNSFKSNTDELPDARLTRNTVNVDVNFAHIFRRAGRLGIDAGFIADGLNRPWIHRDSTLSTTQFRVGADWAARTNHIGYFLGAKYRTFSFNSPDYNMPANPAAGSDWKIYESPTEMRYTVHGGAAYFFSKESSLAGHIDVDFLHYSHFQTFDDLTQAYFTRLPLGAPKAKTLGVVSFDPSYRYKSDLLSAKLGLKLQFTSKSGKTVHVAPDVNVALTPHHLFKAYATLGGGEHINNYASLYNYTPYTSSSVAYNNSHIPFTGEIGLTFGPIAGLSVNLRGGYSVANDWLMPVAVVTDVQDRIDYFFAPINLNAWHAGANIDWRVCNALSLSASALFAPGTLKHSYYLNRDRAKMVLDFAVKVNPIEHLQLDASFSLRNRRSAMVYSLYDAAGKATSSMTKLSSMNSLNIGGSYEIFNWLSVFARFENILNNRAGYLPFLEGQGFKGLFGAEVKF